MSEPCPVVEPQPPETQLLSKETVTFRPLYLVPSEADVTDESKTQVGAWQVAILGIRSGFPMKIMRKIISWLGTVNFIVSVGEACLAEFHSPMSIFNLARLITKIQFPLYILAEGELAQGQNQEYGLDSKPYVQAAPFKVRVVPNPRQLPELLETVREACKKQAGYAIDPSHRWIDLGRTKNEKYGDILRSTPVPVRGSGQVRLEELFLSGVNKLLDSLRIYWQYGLCEDGGQITIPNGIEGFNTAPTAETNADANDGAEQLEGEDTARQPAKEPEVEVDRGVSSNVDNKISQASERVEQGKARGATELTAKTEAAQGGQHQLDTQHIPKQRPTHNIARQDTFPVEAEGMTSNTYPNTHEEPSGLSQKREPVSAYRSGISAHFPSWQPENTPTENRERETTRTGSQGGIQSINEIVSDIWGSTTNGNTDQPQQNTNTNTYTHNTTEIPRHSSANVNTRNTPNTTGDPNNTLNRSARGQSPYQGEHMGRQWGGRGRSRLEVDRTWRGGQHQEDRRGEHIPYNEHNHGGYTDNNSNNNNYNYNNSYNNRGNTNNTGSNFNNSTGHTSGQYNQRKYNDPRQPMGGAEHNPANPGWMQ